MFNNKYNQRKHFCALSFSVSAFPRHGIYLGNNGVGNVLNNVILCYDCDIQWSYFSALFLFKSYFKM